MEGNGSFQVLYFLARVTSKSIVIKSRRRGSCNTWCRLCHGCSDKPFDPFSSVNKRCNFDKMLPRVSFMTFFRWKKYQKPYKKANFWTKTNQKSNSVEVALALIDPRFFTYHVIIFVVFGQLFHDFFEVIHESIQEHGRPFVKAHQLRKESLNWAEDQPNEAVEYLTYQLLIMPASASSNFFPQPDLLTSLPGSLLSASQ